MAYRSSPGVVPFGVLASLALVLSFRTWFQSDVSGVSATAGHYVFRHGVNAWQGSTLWTTAVLLAIASALCGIAMTRMRSRRRATAAALIGVAATIGSAFACLRQWWSIAHPATFHATFVLATGGPLPPADPYTIERDRLAEYAALLPGHAHQTAAPQLLLLVLVLIALLLVVGLLNGAPAGPDERPGRFGRR